MEWSTGPLNLLLMDRYSWSDSPPWRCNSPICISIWWPPSVGSSRSRNRARIRRTNQAATASSANRPNPSNPAGLHHPGQPFAVSLPHLERLPGPRLTRVVSKSPEEYYPKGRRLRQGALRSNGLPASAKGEPHPADSSLAFELPTSSGRLSQSFSAQSAVRLRDFADNSPSAHRAHGSRSAVPSRRAAVEKCFAHDVFCRD